MGTTRKGFSDARIAANGSTAAHNLRLFVESNDLLERSEDPKGWHAAIWIAIDLQRVCLRHAVDRVAGVRTY